MNPKDNRVTTVDALIPELKTLFYGSKDFYYDNLLYPDDLFFDFLAVDDTAFLRRRQKVTIMDIMRWEGTFLHEYTYPVSPKLKSVLEQSNLPTHRFYGAKLRQKGEFRDYCVVQFLKDTYKEVIDYPKSNFCLYDSNNKMINNEFYTFSDCDDFEEKMKVIESNWLKEYEIRGAGNMLLIPRVFKIKKMVIKKEFKDIDIFFQPDLRWIVSERLQKRLIEEGITGVEMTEITDVEIIVEE
jgi:hypothetical protein